MLGSRLSIDWSSRDFWNPFPHSHGCEQPVVRPFYRARLRLLRQTCWSTFKVSLL